MPHPDHQPTPPPAPRYPATAPAAPTKLSRSVKTNGYAYNLAKQKGLQAPKALRMASVAYKLAMPKMDSLPTIGAYVACIAQGIQLEVFDGRDGSQLLYAAQVALTVSRQSKAKK